MPEEPTVLVIQETPATVVHVRPIVEDATDTVIDVISVSPPGGDTVVSVDAPAATDDGDVVAPITSVITVAAEGPRGPTGSTGPVGPPGPSNAFEYTKDVPSTVWTLVHNLGYRPAGVRIFSGDVEVDAIVAYSNDDAMVLTFVEPTAGTAYIS